MDRCCMLCQVLCVGRVKILHVTSWAMAGVRTDVILHVTLSSLCWSSKDITCYVKFFVDRVKMLHVTSWDMAAVRTDVACYVKLFVLTK